MAARLQSLNYDPIALRRGTDLVKLMLGEAVVFWVFVVSSSKFGIDVNSKPLTIDLF